VLLAKKLLGNVVATLVMRTLPKVKLPTVVVVLPSPMAALPSVAVVLKSASKLDNGIAVVALPNV
jgi:hypothetical protein